MINIIRWISLVPASYLGYYFAMISGLAVYLLAESFCPPDAVVSGMCTAEYMKQTEKLLFLVFPGLAAILVVLLPALLAPSKKTVVAVTFYLIGSSFAVYLGVALLEWATLAVSLACGGVTVWSVYVRHHRQKNAQPEMDSP